MDNLMEPATNENGFLRRFQISSMMRQIEGFIDGLQGDAVVAQRSMLKEKERADAAEAKVKALEAENLQLKKTVEERGQKKSRKRTVIPAGSSAQ